MVAGIASRGLIMENSVLKNVVKRWASYYGEQCGKKIGNVVLVERDFEDCL